MIKRRSILLNGICPEVVEMLKDKTVNRHTFYVLRKMKPLRQIEAAELMGTAANWSASYAKALLAATKQDDLVSAMDPFLPRKPLQPFLGNAGTSARGDLIRIIKNSHL